MSDAAIFFDDYSIFDAKKQSNNNEIKFSPRKRQSDDSLSISKINESSGLTGGKASQKITNILYALFNDRFNTETLSKEHQIIRDLKEIWYECKNPNWDGYDAIEISKKVINMTFEFLQKLPNYIISPELVPEPTGEIGMLWEFEGESLTVSIDSNSVITFAGLTKEGGEIFGTIPYSKVIPSRILNELENFTNN